ncbi:MAG: S46 family peptidase [Pirellulaceae bacterium]
MHTPKPYAILIFHVLFCSIAAAEEGMFPMSELGKLDLAAKGIELTAEQLFSTAGETSLVDGVCRVNGCTGSFVSPLGLIITNHHCAYGAIQKASSATQDYLTNGFVAANQAAEIPAPDYTVRVTEDYRDVSQQVLEVVDDSMSFLERTQALEKRRKELEAAAEVEHPGLRAEVAEMFTGKTYVLFLYTYLKDIRLVFAPPQSIGNFGGEEDNWMWPRHTGDFSFMRAYVAPDGSSATFNSANVPYQPKRFVQVEPQGVAEHDAVFLLGYPGRTARHKTASFLKYEQDVRLPLVVDLYNWEIDLLTNAGENDREVEIKHASRMRSLANVEKRSRGQLKGLHRTDILAQRTARELELQQFIMSDPQRAERYGEVLSKLDAVYDELSAETPRELHLSHLRSACQSLSFAHFIIDAAHQRQLPDLEREEPYMDRNYEQSVQRLMVSLSDFDANSDARVLAGILQRLATLDNSINGLASILQKPDEIEATTAAWIAGTQVQQPELVQQLLQKTPTELEKTSDPMLQLALTLYPTYLEMRETDKRRDGELSQLYGSLIDIKQRFLSTNFVPDANGTLRMTIGRVAAYSPEDAVIKTPITSLSGVIDKTTGVEPFITPQIVQDKYRAKDFGPFYNQQIDDVPVAILYDTDTTGGNSGSPIFNAHGRLVGVNFDRCFEATINDFAWNQSYSRSIGVDIRYVLWITGPVYGANHLLDEMGCDVPK